MAAITTTFVRLIDSVEITQLGEVLLSFNIGQPGASAYQSYLATTTDDPKLTEAQWSATFNGVESVTSTDNHIVVDNTDPKNPVLSFQLVDNENFLTDDELANLNNQSGVNTGDQDLSPYQTITDALLETDSDTIVGAINEVNSIAKGANQALSFDDYQAVIAAMLVSGLNAGQNLYVDTLDVPDLWVKVVEVASVPYTYVSDEQFVTDILAGTQIGYYRLALLETQKVDLTNYYTKDETDQAIEDYASPLLHTHSGEDIEPESVTTDQIVLNGFDRLGNPITVNLVYNTDLGVVEFQYPDGTVGQDHLELWFVAKCQGACRNGYGAQFVSSQGGHIVVKEMVASELNTQPQLFMGIFTQTAANGEFIKITWFGSVNDVSTTAYEAEGGAKILYVDMEGSGLRGFTTIIPNAPYRKIMAASIQKYSTGASENGVILVRPTFGTKSQNLDDWDGSTSAFDTGNTIPIRGADGVIREILKSDFYAVLDDYFGALGNANIWSLLQTFTSGLKTTKIIPNSDTTGVVIRNAADGADKFIFDTANGRIGGSVTPTYLLDFTGNISNLLRLVRSGGFGSFRVGTAGFGLVIGNDTTSATNGILGLFANGDAASPGLFILQNQNTQLVAGKYEYNASSPIADTVNDIRTSNVAGVKISEKCFVANATKGSGTWSVKSIEGAEKALTNNVAANILDINCAVNTMQCGVIEYSISAIDTASNTVRSHIGYMSYNIRNQNGVITTNIVHSATLENDLGTITDTWALTNGTNKATLSLTANASGMTPTSMTLYFDVKNQGKNTIVLL